MVEKYKFELFSDIGTSEPFVARLSLGLIEILDVTNFENRKEINDAILNISFEGLLPAFISLGEIRDFETGSKKFIMVNLNKNYYDLYKYLWVAYKDRMQKATDLLGFNLGFLFQKDENFKKGCKKFLEKHSEIDEGFIGILENERDVWQNKVETIRNRYLEHQKLDSKDVEKYFTLENAELMFNNCWQAIEDILVFLMRTDFPTRIDIAVIPEEKRDRGCPKKYSLCFTE